MDENQIQEYPGRVLELDDSFRLIELKPGQDEDGIVVNLLHAHINDAPPYEALSYVWGDPTQVTPIQVTDNESAAGTRQMKVTVNCLAALRRLRGTEETRTLWIDSICINQSLIPERNHQLELIPKIYSGASRVVVYLGETGEDSDTALDWICDIDTPLDEVEDTAPWSSSPKVSKPNAEIIEVLFRRQWFHRVWVLQEIRFAREALVICGAKEVDWGAFRAFKYWNGSMGWVKNLPYVVQWSVMKLTSGYPNNEFLSSYPKRLVKKLKLTREIGATDARDKVLAILPLLDWEEEKFWEQKRMKLRSDYEVDSSETEDDDNDNDTEVADSEEQKELENGSTEQAGTDIVSWTKQDKRGVIIREDYSIPTAELFAQLAMDLINALGLSVLSEIVSPVATAGLPSWAPDWSTNNNYPFVGRSRRAERQLYRSTRFTDIEWNEDTVTEHVPKTWSFSNYSPAAPGASSILTTQLHVRAISLGRIAKLGDMCNVYDDYLPLARWESLVEDRSLLEVTSIAPWPGTGASYEVLHDWELSRLPLFVRTIAGDTIAYTEAIETAVQIIREYNGEEAALKAKYRHLSDAERGEEEGKEKMKLRDIFQSMAVSYEDQAEAIFYTCHGKKFFVLDSGRIGLVPETVETGDEVMALEGAKELFVVRNIKTYGDGKEKVVKLVREAYVQGTTRGRKKELEEALRDFSAAQRLTIR